MQERSIESRTNSHTSGAFSLVVLLLAWPALAGGFAAGTGEPNDPYQIATAEQLTSIGSDPNDLAKHFVLVADIDLDPNLPGNRVFDRAVIAPDTNDTAIRFQGPAFTGVFDGWSHAITGLVIDSNVTYAGLFGMIGDGGQVRNLRLVGGSVQGQASGNRSGPLGGTGGLAAWNQGVITACGCEVLVRGLRGAGGLVGINDGGMIVACYSTGSISGSSRVGGLIGDNGGPVFVSYNTGSVSGGDFIGGLVGYNSYRTISACYSTGSVRGSDFIGGLVGENVGDGVSSCFWDTETSGRTTSDGGTGLTTSQMQVIDTFLKARWDFAGERANGLCDYWQMPVGGGYPKLSIFGSSIPHPLQGGGTAEDPYLLETAGDLGAVWYRPMASYRLTRDIDVSDITWAMAVIPAFSGRLDGQGHEIFWLTIEGREYLGLIGYLARGAAVSHLGVQTGDVHGTGDLVGGLVGMNAGGTVSECYGEGAVNGKGSVGVLVGDNSGTVSACYGRGWASGSWRVGGLVGYNSGVISACHGASWVSGSDFVGGLVGSNGGAISGCDSHSSPVSGGHSVGGLVGDNIGTISACYSDGSIDGITCVGGLVGYSSGAVSVCYSTGSARGNGSVGGLVGYNIDGTISTCYSTTSVSGPYKAGGLVGNNVSSGVVSACFWDTETSGQTNSEGGTGLTTSQMRIADIFLNAGWDFVGERANGLCEYWQMPVADGYPVLSIFDELVPHALRGTGSVNDPYLLETAEDLGVVWRRPTVSYQLAADIDLSGITWGVAVIPLMSGRLDGQSHRIAGLNVAGGGCLGLIGHLAPGAAVSDLALEDVNVAGTGAWVGGIAGINKGAITACSSKGSASGGDDVGGLVGINFGTISSCRSIGSVTGADRVGGLVGYDRGDTIFACYSASSVTGGNYVGGLAGYNGGDAIFACYSTGSVSGDRNVGGLAGCNSSSAVISACFWDTETSGQTTSAGGTGLPTSRMQAIDTFLDAGWDFMGTWCMPVDDYPRLLWEDRCGESE